MELIKIFMNDKMLEDERNKSHIFRICRREKQVCVMVSYIDFKILQRKFEIFKFLKKCKKTNLSQRRRDKLRRRSVGYLALVLRNVFRGRKRDFGVEFLRRNKRIVKIQKGRNDTYRRFREKWDFKKKSIVFGKLQLNFFMARMKKDQKVKGLMALDYIMERKRTNSTLIFFRKISENLQSASHSLEQGQKISQTDKNEGDEGTGGQALTTHLIKNNVRDLSN